MKNYLINQRGITLITLFTTIVILIIITAAISININTSMQVSDLTKLENDIQALSYRVETYYIEYGEIPVTAESFTKEQIQSAISDLSPADGDTYYTIDLSKLDNITLNFGQKYATSSTDKYIINEDSHMIYYLGGISYQNAYYYTADINENVMLLDTNTEYQNRHGVYAIIYSDGSMVFNSDGQVDSNKTLAFKSSNITNTLFDDADSVEWKNYRSSITTITIENKIKPNYMAHWFYYFTNLTEINNIKNIDTSAVKSMKRTFYKCSSLTSLDLKSFDTSNVTSMYSMFYECSSLEHLDVSHFNTANVETMFAMFYECSGLTELDVSHFDTSNVTNMRALFYNCCKVPVIDVSRFNTAKVKNMHSMFYRCMNITTLDVSHFNTAKVEDMYMMFGQCTKLTNLDVSHFDTANVETMYAMFYECSGLTELDVSHFDTSKVENMQAMFRKCYNITSLNLTSFNTSIVSNMKNMFRDCTKLTSITVSNSTWVIGQDTDTTDMFTNCGTNSVTNV